MSKVSCLCIGDKMRFSTELLKQIHDMPNHESEVVVLVGIDRDESGIAVVTVQRADWQERREHGD